MDNIGGDNSSVVAPVQEEIIGHLKRADRDFVLGKSPIINERFYAVIQIKPKRSM